LFIFTYLKDRPSIGKPKFKRSHDRDHVPFLGIFDVGMDNTTTYKGYLWCGGFVNVS